MVKGVSWTWTSCAAFCRSSLDRANRSKGDVIVVDDKALAGAAQAIAIRRRRNKLERVIRVVLRFRLNGGCKDELLVCMAVSSEEPICSYDFLCEGRNEVVLPIPMVDRLCWPNDVSQRSLEMSYLSNKKI